MEGLHLALAEQIVVALVISKLDYCNYLLLSIPEIDLLEIKQPKLSG